MRVDSLSPQTTEARRLIRKFFPESEATIRLGEPLGVYDLVTAMSWGNAYHADYSCEQNPFLENPPDLGLAKLGGVWDEDDKIYLRLLDHTCFTPSGRVVIFPDTFPSEGREPFVCHSRKALERIQEFKNNPQLKIPHFFDNCSDILFVYESGEAMELDHDQRFYWAKSKLRNWTKDAT